MGTKDLGRKDRQREERYDGRGLVEKVVVERSQWLGTVRDKMLQCQS